MYVLTLRAFQEEHYRGHVAVSSPPTPPVGLDLTAPFSLVLSPGLGYLQAALRISPQEES